MAEIVLLQKAVEDIRKSRDWYDEKEVNLGKLYVEKVNECVASIAENPKAYPVKYRFLRARLVASFPYSVFYNIERKGLIRIYACLHHKQNADRTLGKR
ncbi:MAG: type II toxin-antitoxin system RelE/ParE family toxin [Bacteroidetes bacterium]|jgi:plasmid stabilization system protein ParE|nr:type II toxin-antitoxin system RelE/ParE family toxin [Bacteroidota bacterium]